MKLRNLFRISAAALGGLVAAGQGVAQTQPPARGPAEGGSPAWLLQGSFPDPGGNTAVDPDGRVTVLPRTGGPPPPGTRTPPCSRSPVCGNRLAPGRQMLQRVQWEQTLGYVFTYPLVLPAGPGGVPSVALDSKNNLWVFQRKAAGNPSSTNSTRTSNSYSRSATT